VRRFAGPCAIALVISLAGRAAQAEGPTPGGTADESSVAEGERYWTAADFVRAHAAFERAYRQTGSLSAGLKSAQALVRLGRLLEAAARYEALISSDVGPGRDADPAAIRQEAATDLQQLLVRIPRLSFAIIGAPSAAVALALNGVQLKSPLPPAGVPVNPGRYLVSGRLKGRTIESYVDLGEGDVTTVTLRFGDPELPPAAGNGSNGLAPNGGLSGRRLVGVVTLGVGMAALVTGGFIGWSALNDEESLADRCPHHRCADTLQSEVDAYEAKKLIALVGMVSGGVLLGAGTLLYFSAPVTPKVGLYLAPGGAGLKGRF
jgi:hypothetical protein